MKARVATVAGFSAHADEDEISRWLAGFEAPPGRTFLVHGEPSALLAATVRMERLGWSAGIARHLEEVEL